MNETSEPLYRIKSFEWYDPDENYDMKRGKSQAGDNYYLDLPLMGYRAEWRLSGLGVNKTGSIYTYYNTEEEAKAAAQNHYEQRVKECLIEVKPE